MPDCHSCPHNLKRSRACLKCKGPAATHHHGKSFISIEHMPDRETAIKPPASKRKQYPLANFFALWLRLDPDTRDLVARMVVQHEDLTRVHTAKKLRITTQAVHQRLMTAVRQIPELKAVLRLRMRSIKT
jgi:hypothetical protein